MPTNRDGKKFIRFGLFFGWAGVLFAIYQYIEPESFSPVVVIFLLFGVVFYYRGRQLNRKK